jgi:PAS domain-containing protein
VTGKPADPRNVTNQLSVVEPVASPDGVRSPQHGFAAAVLDAIPDATAILDRQGRITAINRAWRMFTLDNAGSPETTGVG